MKTINVQFTQTEGVLQPASCWPECVEQSYERLMAALTTFVTGEQGNNVIRVESAAALNHFAL